MRKIEPKVTRKTISEFEFVRVVTILARYIENSKTLYQFTDQKTTISNVVNSAQLATMLLKNGKFDAIISRPEEDVTFSSLIVNPSLYKQLEDYFSEKEEITKNMLENIKIINKNIDVENDE